MFLLIDKEMSNAIRGSKIHPSFKGAREVTHAKVLLGIQTLNSGHPSQGF